MLEQLTHTKVFITSLDFATASEFVNRYHRHNKAPVGHLFSIGLFVQGNLEAVAICGRPIARKLDNRENIEIYRVCSKGYKNACSMLISYCCKTARKKRFKKVLTYTLLSENGASLKASNFILEATNVGKIAWTGKRKHVSQIKELKNRWVYHL